MAIVVLALSAPVSAQNYLPGAMQNLFDAINTPSQMALYNLCEKYRGTGSREEMSYCYGNRFGAGGYRGNRFRLGQYGTRPYGYGNGFERIENETPGKCVERTTKAFRKSKTDVDPALVLAACMGMPPPPPEREPYRDTEMRSSYEAPQQPAQRVPEHASSNRPPVRTFGVLPSGVFSDSENLYNGSLFAISVHVNGQLIGQLASKQLVSLTSLPTGTINVFLVN